MLFSLIEIEYHFSKIDKLVDKHGKILIRQKVTKLCQNNTVWCIIRFLNVKLKTILMVLEQSWNELHCESLRSIPISILIEVRFTF